MANRIRVRLAPLTSPLAAPNQLLVDGARVKMEMLGPFGSELNAGDSVPATLKFEARYFESERERSAEKVELLTKLEGSLLLEEDAPRHLRFDGNVDSAGKPVGLQPAERDASEGSSSGDPETEDPRDKVQNRVLRFIFDADQFRNVNTKNGEPVELLVPMKPMRFRYCEVSVGLELNGRDEAPRKHNEILDVLITARNPRRRVTIELRLTDLNGEPLPNARCAIVSGARPADETGDLKALVADGDGLLRLVALDGTQGIEVEWRPASADAPLFRRTLFMDFDEDPTEADQKRLNNLGYIAETVRQNVLAFQADFEREPTGLLDDIRKDLRAWHDDGVKPLKGGAN